MNAYVLDEMLPPLRITLKMLGFLLWLAVLAFGLVLMARGEEVSKFIGLAGVFVVAGTCFFAQIYLNCRQQRASAAHDDLECVIAEIEGSMHHVRI